jgi:ribonucleoside-diphosphate reductase alpha chain
VHYDDWKDSDLVETMTFFLDTVTTEYINKTKSIPFMGAAHNFASRQRAIGLGVLGWHTLLQNRMIAFESMEAKFLNSEIFKKIDSDSLEASKKLAELYGEPELMVGTGERMATRLAIAPTTSSSFILGQVSRGIEPIDSNYFVEKLSKGNFTFKNPALKKLLKKYDRDNSDTWDIILKGGGSVQRLDFLSDHEKEVFRTFGEISQKEIVIQACQRQKFIDQSQSLNLMIPPDTPARDVSQLMIFGWQNGIKGYYYQKGANPSQLINRSILECKSCEG